METENENRPAGTGRQIHNLSHRARDNQSIPQRVDRYHDLRMLAGHLTALRRRYRHLFDADLSDAFDDVVLLMDLTAETEVVRHG